MQYQFQIAFTDSLPLPPVAGIGPSQHTLITNTANFKIISNMAPKLQSKTLETKAQTCPPFEDEFPAEAAAESSGDEPEGMT